MNRGAINAGDVARIRTQKLESDQALDSALQTLRQARVALAFLIGVRGTVPDFDVESTVLDFSIPSALNTTEDQLLRSAFDRRPDLIAMGYQKASAAAQIALTKRQVFPDLTLGLNYQQGGYGGLGTNGPVAMPMFTVSISGALPVFYQLQGEVRQAEAQYDTNALLQAKITAQVSNDVASAWAAEEASRRLAQRMLGPDGLLESAKTAFEITALQYDKGAATLTDYLDAYRTYIATQVEQYQDLTNYWTAVYQLEQAAGIELRR